MDLLSTSYNKLELLAVDADHLLGFVVRRWQSWRTCSRLMALTDRQLKDIGLARSEIERAAPPGAASGGGAAPASRTAAA